MSTLLISNIKFSLNKFWGGDKTMYQITQRYSSKSEDTYTRNTWGWVHLSKEDLKQILEEIEKHEE